MLKRIQWSLHCCIQTRYIKTAADHNAQFSRIDSNNIYFVTPHYIISIFSRQKIPPEGFFFGQRQLICLAKVLLRRSKIILFDEATSSVGPNTDAHVLQETIWREFVSKGPSVITVARQLDTVLGYDKIAVIGDGELIEFGHPELLLQNKNGHFCRLVDADTQNKMKGAKDSTQSVKDLVVVQYDSRLKTLIRPVKNVE